MELLRARPWSWLLSLLAGVSTARSRTLWATLPNATQGRVNELLAHGGDVTPWL
jgi:hypothetical protein